MADNHVTAVRAFIAVPLPGSVRHLLSEFQAGLKSAGIKASWPRPDSFHLTVKFLGDTPCDRLEKIQAVMDRFSGQYPDIVLAAGSMGVFPKIKKAGVVWADVKGETRRLEQLGHEMDNALHRIGISKQKRPFSPHITLARIKARVSCHTMEKLIQEYADRWSDPFSADSMVLYESTLSAGGAVHTRMFQTNLCV